MISERDAIAAVDRLIDGRWYDKRLRPDDPDGQRRWAVKNADGHVIEVNWEGTTELKADDAWLSFLPAFTQLELVHLDYNPAFTGEGLKYLIGLPIKQINLTATAVSDDALVHLSKIPTLEWLRLNDSEVGDEGLKHLAGLKNLKGIELFRTPVSDAGLKHLAGLQELEHLNLSTQDTTEVGIRNLQTALPRCEILSKWSG